MIKKISNISDQGIICDFGDEVNKEINKKVITLFNSLRKEKNKGKLDEILNIVPSYNKLAVQFDLRKTNSKKIRDLVLNINTKNNELTANVKKWIFPICYDDEFALDLKDLSKNLKIDREELIEEHLKTEFYTYMIGFMPGHPYMGDLDKKLFSSRLKTPRTKVPAGSVAIAEKFCIVYPYESPGGWNIIGRTNIKLFDTKNPINPCLLNPGDVVSFKRVNKKEI